MILDTCALLWLAEGGKKFSKGVLKQIAEAPVLYVSVITGFELALKVRSGKLKLPCDPQRWLNEILPHHGIEVLALDLVLCVRAAELPPIHADPCDRFIIASSLIHDLPVVTSDSRFAEYGVKTLF